ncbi:hypothetical protein ACJRO7_000415 [Eucalyptus globulus]|uniref:Uncharacterized protein n=1 Tax=Eucalyptus globulus TaxID=34317 RepID=A0ABD3LXB2_EUCGL
MPCKRAPIVLPGFTDGRRRGGGTCAGDNGVPRSAAPSRAEISAKERETKRRLGKLQKGEGRGEARRNRRGGGPNHDGGGGGLRGSSRRRVSPAEGGGRRRGLSRRETEASPEKERRRSTERRSSGDSRGQALCSAAIG